MVFYKLTKDATGPLQITNPFPVIVSWDQSKSCVTFDAIKRFKIEDHLRMIPQVVK